MMSPERWTVLLVFPILTYFNRWTVLNCAELCCFWCWSVEEFAKLTTYILAKDIARRIFAAMDSHGMGAMWNVHVSLAFPFCQHYRRRPKRSNTMAQALPSLRTGEIISFQITFFSKNFRVLWLWQRPELFHTLRGFASGSKRWMCHVVLSVSPLKQRANPQEDDERDEWAGVILCASLYLIYLIYIYIHIFKHIHICMYTYTYLCISIHIYVYLYIYIYIFVSLYISIFIYLNKSICILWIKSSAGMARSLALQRWTPPS